MSRIRHRMILVFPGLILGLGAACGPSGPCDQPFTASFHLKSAPPVAGQTQRVSVSGVTPASCLGVLDVLKLEGRVRRPDGTEAALGVEALERGTHRAERILSADLLFDSPAPGTYELILAIAPLRTEVRQPVSVAAPRPEVRTHLMTLAEADCARPLETSRGTLICDNRVLRDGRTVQTLPGFLGIGGDAVWSYDRGVVRRYLDQGSGTLAQDPPLSFQSARPFPRAPGYFEAATRTEWTLAHGDEVNRFRVAGRFLQEEPAPLQFRDVQFDGLIRAGERVVLHSTQGEVRKLCHLAAPAGGPLTLIGACEADDRASFFSEPEGTLAWRCALEPQGLNACALDGPGEAGLMRAGMLHLDFTAGFVFEPWRGYHNSASARGFVPKLGDGLLLEEAVLPPGWGLFGLTPTRIVGQHRSLQQIGFFRR